MKVIVDVPEDVYYEIQDNEEFVQNFPDRYNMMILNGTPLLTNGSAVTALFPTCEVKTFSEGSYYADEVRVKLPMVYGHTTWHSFSKQWWNAPYKAEREE